MRNSGKFFHKEKSYMTATLITGKVEKFILVIDPENRKGRVERIEFNDAASMTERCKQLDIQDRAEYRPTGWWPTERLYFTYYRRDDDGTIVEQNSFSLPMSGRPACKVGDAAYFSKCKCGDSRWSEFSGDEEYDSCITGQHLCEKCNKPDEEDNYFDSDNDFNNYDGSREREY